MRFEHLGPNVDALWRGILRHGVVVNEDSRVTALSRCVPRSSFRAPSHVVYWRSGCALSSGVRSFRLGPSPK